MADFFIPNANEFWARFAPSLGRPPSPTTNPTPLVDDASVLTHDLSFNNNNNNNNNNDQGNSRPVSVKRKDGVRFEGGLFNDDGTIRTGLNRSKPPFSTLHPFSTLPLFCPLPHSALSPPRNPPSQYTLSIHPFFHYSSVPNLKTMMTIGKIEKAFFWLPTKMVPLNSTPKQEKLI